MAFGNSCATAKVRDTWGFLAGVTNANRKQRRAFHEDYIVRRGWRRNELQDQANRQVHVRGRTLRLESLESRALLTASAASTFSPYDVNHDGYLNMADVISEISYYNTHGPGAIYDHRVDHQHRS